MFGFVTIPSARLPFRSLVRPQICDVGHSTRTVSTSSRIGSSTVTRMMTTPDAIPPSEADELEDDDSTLGARMGTTGMQLPDLNESDKTYLDAATSDADFMRRMTDIARQKDMERQRNNIELGRVGPDEYMASLSRRRAPAPEPSEPIEHRYRNSGDEYVDKLQNMQSAPSSSAKSTPAPPVKAQTPPSSAGEGKKVVEKHNIVPEMQDLDKQIEELQAQLQDTAGSIDPVAEGQSASSSIGADPETGPIDEQIKVLESYLESLKVEEEEEEEEEEDNDESSESVSSRFESALQTLETHVSQTSSQGSGMTIEGLQDTPGPMSMEEKMEAFDAIREQARRIRGERGIVDPLAAPPLNSKADRPVDKVQGTGSEHTTEDITGEIEAEMNRYAQNARELLRSHEARMADLLARLGSS